MRIAKKMPLLEKLKILAGAAKYDVACTSSGVNRKGRGDGMGNTESCGICHTFAADGRCISLLKILFTNECIFDCKYCINRKSNDVKRASFTPEEICSLTMQFYRRNYIEGLFLSSGIMKTPDYTMSLLYETLWKLRNEYKFFGYIHVKAIPGASAELIERVGFLADRMSVNLELPTKKSLSILAPNKNYRNIMMPMRQIRLGIGNLLPNQRTSYELLSGKGYRTKSRFVPAGQSTQMIIGATPETDYQLMTVTEYMYREMKLKRVFYSAFVDVNHNIDAPAVVGANPLLREHRLYQADWLLRYYGFQVKELLDEKHPNFNVVLDPKCDWAVNHLERFPVEVMSADYYLLLRVPGIGIKSASRIVLARRYGILNFSVLKKMGVVLKRAAYFITCNGKTMFPLKLDKDYIARHIADTDRKQIFAIEQDTTYKQMTLMDLECKRSISEG